MSGILIASNDDAPRLPILAVEIIADLSVAFNPAPLRRCHPVRMGGSASSRQLAATSFISWIKSGSLAESLDSNSANVLASSSKGVRVLEI